MIKRLVSVVLMLFTPQMLIPDRVQAAEYFNDGDVTWPGTLVEKAKL